MVQAHECPSGSCTGGQTGQNEKSGIEEALERIAHKIVVLSGKGGVGKSTVAVNLAVSLSGKGGYRVGLLDIDIHGPSIPKMLGLEGTVMVPSNRGKLIPALFGSLKVMSIGFLLPGEMEAVVWREPAKRAAIRHFIGEVEWGNLDYLIVDCPPGVGDEPMTLIRTLDRIDGVVVVTTPQDLAVANVRKSICFCGQFNLPVLGVIENMSGLVCPSCGETIDVFKCGGGESLALEMRVPFLGRVPLDPRIVTAGDGGAPYGNCQSDTESDRIFSGIVSMIVEKTGKGEER